MTPRRCPLAVLVSNDIETETKGEVARNFRDPGDFVIYNMNQLALQIFHFTSLPSIRRSRFETPGYASERLKEFAEREIDNPTRRKD
jgi:hypothetical protein